MRHLRVLSIRFVARNCHIQGMQSLNTPLVRGCIYFLVLQTQLAVQFLRFLVLFRPAQATVLALVLVLALVPARQQAQVPAFFRQRVLVRPPPM